MQDRVGEADVATLRAFNRAYTSRLGLLNTHLDNSPFTLSEARVLFELAHRTDPTAADIARALLLDRAQLSRTLKRFATRGLLEWRDQPLDARHRLLSLTSEGRRAFEALDHKTRDAIGRLLDSLSATRRKRLLSAATAITQVFEREPSTVSLRNLGPGDLGWITHRQAILYAEEYGWNNDYEVLVARILAELIETFDPEREAGWVAEIDEAVVGSIFLVRADTPGVGKLRLLYVEPDARGTGVGGLLIAACIERARQVGYARLDLWTNSVLVAARRLYERAGFELIDETPHYSFGQQLVGQTWSLDLRG